MPKNLFASFISLALGLLMFVLPAYGQREEHAGKFRRTEKSIRESYIVVFADTVERSQVAALAHNLALRHGGEIKFTYEHALKGFAVKLPEAAALALSRNPQVAYVEEETVSTLDQAQQFLTSNNTTFYGLDRIDQRDLPLNSIYSYFSGGEARAYVLDSGISPIAGHPNFNEFYDPTRLQSRVAVSYDTFGGDGFDRNNHGTAVSAIIGSKTYGVSKAALIRSVKVCDDSANCPNFNVIAGLDWVIAHHVKPAVVNMSLGGPPSSALDTAVRNTIAAGVLTVVSAGNDGIDASSKSPARVTEALTVGATLINDSRAPYSNYGTVVDLFAPGGRVPDQGIPTFGVSSVIAFDGTSAAAPHVTGVALQYLSIRPTAFPFELAEAIKNNATLNRVSNAGPGTPNRLLYSGFIGGVSPSPSLSPAAIDTSVIYRIVAKHSGKCMDVLGGSQSNGARVVQSDCHLGTNQQWQFTDMGGGYYKLAAVHSGMCLDVQGGSTADGAALVQSSCHNGTNQQFTFLQGGSMSGYHNVRARHSGRALDVQGGSLASGAYVLQFQPHEGENQQWRIEPVPTAPISPDNDGDGFGSDQDCNDSDPWTYPGASTSCEYGQDRNCNGQDDYEECYYGISYSTPLVNLLKVETLFNRAS